MMMSRRIPMVGSSLTVLLLMVQLSLAGTVIEQQVKDRDERPTQVILYFSGNQLRTDHPESGMATILDFKNDQIVLIDHRSKNYLSMKLSQWEKQAAVQLKKGNPAGQPKERVITVRGLGEIAMVNGYRTEKVQVLADGEVIEEHSMTKDIDMNEVDRIMEMGAQGLSTEARSQLKEGREILRKLKPYGFSIRVRDYTTTNDRKGIDVLEVKKIERKELKPEVFHPPAGYQKITPPPAKK
jgi:hypothetical protein